MTNVSRNVPAKTTRISQAVGSRSTQPITRRDRPGARAVLRGRLGHLDDGLHRRRVHLADDLEGALLAEPVAVGLALAGLGLGGEARALHVVRSAVAPYPLDGSALADLDRLVGADLPG